jgi:hypothetical protein
VIKRHTARAVLAAEAGEPERGLEDARAVARRGEWQRGGGGATRERFSALLG